MRWHRNRLATALGGGSETIANNIQSQQVVATPPPSTWSAPRRGGIDTCAGCNLRTAHAIPAMPARNVRLRLIGSLGGGLAKEPCKCYIGSTRMAEQLRAQQMDAHYADKVLRASTLSGG